MVSGVEGEDRGMQFVDRMPSFLVVNEYDLAMVDCCTLILKQLDFT